MPQIEGIRVPFMPAGGVRELRKTPARPGSESQKTSFEDLFQRELRKLNFSKHAQTRMISREMNLSDAEMTRLEKAVDKAEEKGVRESLVLFEDKAFIVSVDNRTVITAVSKEQLSSGVITNIDSAVMA